MDITLVPEKLLNALELHFCLIVRVISFLDIYAKMTLLRSEERSKHFPEEFVSLLINLMKQDMLYSGPA